MIEIPLKYAAARPGAPAVLDYETRAPAPSRPGMSVQPLYRGRLELWPLVDLRNYEFSAVLDWVEIDFQTLNVHRAVDIEKFASKCLNRKPWVSGPNGEEHYEGTEFVVKVQDPKPAEFFPLCAALQTKYGIDTADGLHIDVRGVELALDIKPIALAFPDRDDGRQLMTETIRRHLAPNPRFFDTDRRRPRSVYMQGRWRKTHFMIERPSSAHEEKAEESEHEEQDAAYFRDLALGSYKRVPVDGTFYLGDKNEVVLIRVQDKITDQRDKRRRTFRSLGPEERRSRIEIALEARSPAEFGVELPVDLGRRRFSALVNQAFRMGIPTLRMDDAGEPAKEELQIFQRAGLIGLDRFQRACHLRQEIKALTDKRKGAEVRHLREKGYWRAWTEFNQRSLKAVDRLDHAWERAEARFR